jgi:hypothetical protein
MRLALFFSFLILIPVLTTSVSVSDTENSIFSIQLVENLDGEEEKKDSEEKSKFYSDHSNKQPFRAFFVELSFSTNVIFSIPDGARLAIDFPPELV